MSTIRTNEILHSDGSTTNEPSIPALDQRMAKAWVSFNGTSTVAIRDSYNVSSITDNSVGKYTVNFSVAMNNANYSVVAGGRWTDVRAGTYYGTNTVSSCQIATTAHSSTTKADADTVTAIFMGG